MLSIILDKRSRPKRRPRRAYSEGPSQLVTARAFLIYQSSDFKARCCPNPLVRMEDQGGPTRNPKECRIRGEPVHTLSKYPSSLTVLSLFSGCGGLDLGFVNAGFQLKLSIDHLCCHQISEAWPASYVGSRTGSPT